MEGLLGPIKQSEHDICAFEPRKERTPSERDTNKNQQ